MRPSIVICVSTSSSCCLLSGWYQFKVQTFYGMLFIIGTVSIRSTDCHFFSPERMLCVLGWRDCSSQTRPKSYDAERVVDLYNEVRACRALDDSSSSSSGSDLPNHSHYSTKPSSTIKKGLRGLFSSQSAKFAKSAKRLVRCSLLCTALGR